MEFFALDAKNIEKIIVVYSEQECYEFKNIERISMANVLNTSRIFIVDKEKGSWNVEFSKCILKIKE